MSAALSSCASVRKSPGEGYIAYFFDYLLFCFSISIFMYCGSLEWLRYIPQAHVQQFSFVID